jgi:hypothetical protein
MYHEHGDAPTKPFLSVESEAAQAPRPLPKPHAHRARCNQPQRAGQSEATEDKKAARRVTGAPL